MPWKALLPYHISHRIKPKLHISALRSKRQPLTLYGGQFTLSTQLITLNYPVLLFHWRSTTVSLETYPLYKRSSCIRWLVYRAWCETVRLRFRVHHNPSPSTQTATHHLPFIDLDKDWECYSVCSTEAIFIVLLCEDERTLDLHHCACIWLSPTYQCVFQFEIFLNNI